MSNEALQTQHVHTDLRIPPPKAAHPCVQSLGNTNSRNTAVNTFSLSVRDDPVLPATQVKNIGVPLIPLLHTPHNQSISKQCFLCLRNVPDHISLCAPPFTPLLYSQHNRDLVTRKADPVTLFSLPKLFFLVHVRAKSLTVTSRA